VIFRLACGRRAKWVVFLVWLVGIVVAVGPLQLPTKFSDAENNESSSYLPEDAESTKALTATEDLQGGELASAVIVYYRPTGLTAADRAKIQEDVQRLTRKRFPGVIRDGAKAAGGGPPVRRPNGCAGPSTPVPGQPADYRPFVGPVCSDDGNAAILTAYIRGNGQGDTILDPVDYWRDQVSDPGGAWRSRSRAAPAIRRTPSRYSRASTARCCWRR
jgi:RND superfamily putative drug exporter